MKSIWRSILLAVSVLVCASAVHAQSGLGNISGHVTDPSGAVIPGAAVAIINVETGVRKEAMTNGAGVYEARQLVAGRYRLEVSATNFKKLVRDGVTVQVEDNIGLDLTLALGASTETVEVHSDASALRTEDAQTGEVITNELIESIPNVSTGSLRDPFSLVGLAGNVQGSGGRAGLQLGLQGGIYSGQADTRVNGGRTGATEYLVDGVPVTEGFTHNVANATPATEDVAEFKVITNGLSAEYGRLSGGALSIATQAGTKDFHGQLFEYHQDAFLNANNVQNTGQTPIASKSNFRQNDFGVAIGGPVIVPHVYDGRKKTFWFANYEGLRNSGSGNLNQLGTITDQERTGDLSDIGGTSNPKPMIYDPYQNSYPNMVLDPTTNSMGYQKYLAGGDGMHIPQAEINPIIKGYISLLPHPNHAPVAGSGTAGNFVVRQPTSVTQTNWSARVDQNLSEKSSLYGRFSYSSGSTFTGPLNPVLGTYGTTNIDGGYSAVLHYTHSFTPTTLLDLRVGGNYNPFDTGSHIPHFNNSGLGYSSEVTGLIGTDNILNIHNGPFTETTNYGNIGGPGGGQLWQLLQAGSYTNVNSSSYNYAGSLTKILGRHSLKFGYEGRRYFDNVLQSAQAASVGNGNGSAYTADAVVNQYTDQSNGTWSPQAYDDGLGQFLLGIDTWTTTTSATGRSLASNYYASYVQDDFKVDKKLTFNFGLRWEMESPVSERHNNLSVWDPSAASPFNIVRGYSWTDSLTAAGLDPAQVQTPPWLNGYVKGNLVLVGTPEHPSRLATNRHPWNFSPRFGFAYSLDSKTVVRGSFALLYLPTSGNLFSYGNAPGVAYSDQANNDNNQYSNANGLPQTGLNSISAPFGASQLLKFQHSTYAADLQTAQSGVGTGGIDIHSHMPMEADWGLSVQRELPGGWLVEALYSANNSTSLLGTGNPSRFPAALHTGGPSGTNAKTYSTKVASPFGTQVPCASLPNAPCTLGATENLGILEYAYPYYGPVQVQGQNIGKSNYESASLRVEHRFKGGLYTLFNYTYSKSLDDAGGADSDLAGPGTPHGTGGKPFQQVFDIGSSYGLSVFDIPHKASLTYIYDLPFGRGRTWMNHWQGVAGGLLEGIAGGWDFAGHTTWYSGTPITTPANNTQADNPSGSTNVYDYFTELSLLPGKKISDMFNKNFKGPKSVYSPAGHIAASQSVSRFDPTAVDSYGGTPQTNPFTVTPFTNGNLPYTIGSFRNPGNWTTDLSFMKRFPFTAEGSRYFQLRLEATNAFNHPGYGSYDNNPNDNTFGQVTSPANGERHIQVGGRVVF